MKIKNSIEIKGWIGFFIGKEEIFTVYNLKIAKEIVEGLKKDIQRLRLKEKKHE